MKSWRKWLAVFALVAGVAYLFRSLAGEALRAGAGLLTAVIYLAAYLFAIVVVPLGGFWLFMFVYSVFLRPYLRAWHINRIRNARALREALHRDQGRDS
jgi:hypothetical protein